MNAQRVGLAKSRLVRYAVLGGLAAAAYGLITLRSNAELAKAEAMCVDGVVEFESAITGSKVECRRAPKT